MQVGLLIGGFLLKYGPDIAQEVAVLLHKEDPTLDDWKAVFAKVRSYDEIMADVPNAVTSANPTGASPAPAV